MAALKSATGLKRRIASLQAFAEARDRMLTLFFRMDFIDEATDEAWDAKRQELGV
jgi:hypothetical protein